MVLNTRSEVASIYYDSQSTTGRSNSELKACQTYGEKPPEITEPANQICMTEPFVVHGRLTDRGTSRSIYYRVKPNASMPMLEGVFEINESSRLLREKFYNAYVIKAELFALPAGIADNPDFKFSVWRTRGQSQREDPFTWRNTERGYKVCIGGTEGCNLESNGPVTCNNDSNKFQPGEFITVQDNIFTIDTRGYIASVISQLNDNLSFRVKVLFRGEAVNRWTTEIVVSTERTSRTAYQYRWQSSLNVENGLGHLVYNDDGILSGSVVRIGPPLSFQELLQL